MKLTIKIHQNPSMLVVRQETLHNGESLSAVRFGSVWPAPVVRLLDQLAVHAGAFAPAAHLPAELLVEYESGRARAQCWLETPGLDYRLTARGWLAQQDERDSGEPWLLHRVVAFERAALRRQMRPSVDERVYQIGT